MDCVLYIYNIERTFSLLRYSLEKCNSLNYNNFEPNPNSSHHFNDPP